MKLLSIFLVCSLLVGCLSLSAAAMEEEPILEKEPFPEEIPLEAAVEESPATEPDETLPEPLLLSTSADPEPGLYFGLLHSHSSLSGGEGTPEEAYLYARDTAGLDFFALTEHSDSFDGADYACLEEDAASVSEKWAAGKAAAQNATTEDFVALFGFEMSWPRQKQLGHISTLFTPGFQSWEQPEFSSAHTGLAHFYDVLAAVPGAVAQFNHPGTLYGTFSDFGHYSAEADQVITLLEIGSGESEVDESGYFSALSAYFRALDKGWHLAPVCKQANHQGLWGTANSVRTALWTDSLTETGIQEALGSYRVYATEDSDLQIHYTLDGHFMGSRVKLAQLGETADIAVSLYDPTDDAIGLVEVVCEGGETVASQQLDAHEGVLNFTLSPDHAYYCLKITQPDGDTALTAPVWVELPEYAGIQALTCRDSVPVQGKSTLLDVTLYNRENAALEVKCITVTSNGESLLTVESPEEASELRFSIPILWDKPGSPQFEVTVSARLGGQPREYTAEITLFFRQSEQIRDILLDGTHDNFLPEEITALTALAAEENIRLFVESEEITPEMLETCGLLVIPPPGSGYNSQFLNLVRDYAAYGGSILVLGGNTNSAHQNRILKAVSSTMTIKTSENGLLNSTYPISTQEINRKAFWCASVSENQVFRLATGRSLNLGSADWLVKGADAVLLAAEPLSGGGTVFAAGGWFLGDADLSEPENTWAVPFANHTIARNILGMAARELPLTTIRQARSAPTGALLRLQGHVTAALSDTLYLQDDTGGIAVTGQLPDGIAVGTHLKITGTAGTDGFGPNVTCADSALADGATYRYLPKTGDWKTLLDPDLHGGELVEAEGICTDTLLSADGILETFHLSDPYGNTVTAVIAPGTGSSNTDLAETVLDGRTIRVIGILAEGTQGPLIRVRSCDEVVYVPPENQTPEPTETTEPAQTEPKETPEYINPKTGDPVFQILPGLFLWSLPLFFRRRK